MDYDDNCSYVGLEGHPTEFNRDFYALAGRDHTEMEDWYTSPSSDWDDWFDEDLGVHSVTASLANSGSSSIAHMCVNCEHVPHLGMYIGLGETMRNVYPGLPNSTILAHPVSGMTGWTKTWVFIVSLLPWLIVEALLLL